MNKRRVASPCVSICALDGDDICIGCFRSGGEISRWGLLAEDQQRDILQRAEARMRGEVVACLTTQADVANDNEFC